MSANFIKVRSFQSVISFPKSDGKTFRKEVLPLIMLSVSHVVPLVSSRQTHFKRLDLQTGKKPLKNSNEISLDIIRKHKM